MARFSWKESAPDESVFAHDAFASQVGKSISVKLGPQRETTGTLVSVVVAEDGRSATFTVATTEQIPEL